MRCERYTKVICVINQLVGVPWVRAGLAFICWLGMARRVLLIDVAQRRRLY